MNRTGQPQHGKKNGFHHDLNPFIISTCILPKPPALVSEKPRKRKSTNAKSTSIPKGAAAGRAQSAASKSLRHDPDAVDAQFGASHQVDFQFQFSVEEILADDRYACHGLRPLLLRERDLEDASVQ